MDEFIEFLIANRKRLDLSFEPYSFGMAVVASGRELDQAEKTCLYGTRITICGRPVESVFWSEGRIALHSLGLRQDAVSFEFSGCVMGVFRRLGRWWAVHIYAAPASSPGRDCKRAWSNYVVNHSISRMVLFRPDYRYTGLDSDRFLLWGVITKEGNCYSLFVEPDPNDNTGTIYKLRYIRRHTAGTSIGDYAPLWRLPPVSPTDIGADYSAVTAIWDDFWTDNLGQLYYDYECCDNSNDLRGAIEL